MAALYHIVCWPGLVGQLPHNLLTLQACLALRGSMHHEQSRQSTAQHGMIRRLLACHGNASLLQPAAEVAMR